MKLPAIKWGPVIVATTVLTALSLFQAVSAFHPKANVLAPLKWMVFDWRARLALDHPHPCATNLAAVFIDEESLELLDSGALGYQISWPFPRAVHGLLVRELAAQGAKCVGFDIMFGEQRPDLELPLNLPESSDEFFAVQLKKASNIVLAAETSQGVLPTALFRTNTWAVGDITSEKDSDGKLRRLHAFSDYRIWHPLIKDKVTMEGYKMSTAAIEHDRIVFSKETSTNFVIHIDSDGLFDPAELAHGALASGQPQRQRPFTVERYWHLGIVLAARELGFDLDKSIVDLKNGRIVLQGPNGLKRIIPVDRQGRFLIDWALTWDDSRLFHLNYGAVLSLDALRNSPQPEDHLTYLEHLKQEGIKWQGDYPFRDKLVVVGSKMVGSNLSDMGPTPISPHTYFVSTHWNVANSIITGRFLRECSYANEWLLVMVLGLIAAVAAWRMRVIWASLLLIAIAALFVISSAIAHVYFLCWVPVVTPVLGGLLTTHVCMVTYRVVFEQRERRRVKSVFSKLVSPDVVNELLKAEHLSLGGARHEVTVYFADVRGFTEMTDMGQARAAEYVHEHGLTGEAAKQRYDQEAREVLATVNLYLGAIADIVKKHNGTLDKYIGDCVMAFWGAPAPNEQHAVQCVRAAIEAQRAIEMLNQQRAIENKSREQENADRLATGQSPMPMLSLLSLGTGINTGTVTVGLMGSDAHILNYTIFGREVNLASRLEGVSGWGRIIISESTFEALRRDDPDLAGACLEQAAVTVKGFRKPVRIFEAPWRQAAPTAAEPVKATQLA